jgi:hypothetical protein
MADFEHAAAWLVGTAALNAISLLTLDATSRLVLDAVSVGEEAAISWGVPVGNVSNSGTQILTAAKRFASDLTRTSSKPTPKSRRA